MSLLELPQEVEKLFVLNLKLLRLWSKPNNGRCVYIAHASDIKNHLKHVNDKAFAETLQHGVGFYHEALSKQDK